MNQNSKESNSKDSVINKSDTPEYTVHEILFDSIQERISDTIASIKDIKEFAFYLDTATKGQRKMLIFVNKPNREIDNSSDYSVQIGEDNGSMFVAHYNFYVNPKTFSIRYYDIPNDTIISLKEWQRTSKSQ